ncbi:hypothetical protein [Halorhabdus amylolytica]|uniref:hypothetical protein n=1 Tax=Halorhabdus amylolytica TaxID=2559573 RepID=UPI0010AAD004|nr:hypothetical protein [Halorhabdus amylolytica]
MSEYPSDGAWPGVRGPNLSKEPLGTAGELTPGPDHLDPDKPRDREELQRLGFEIVDYDESDSDRLEGVDDWPLGNNALDPFFGESDSDRENRPLW